MPVPFHQTSSNPLVIPEIASLTISHVDAPVDLLHCSCINSVWSTPALQKLYRGSMNDMRFRTPEIGWLNSLFVASRERFARNVGFIQHLTIAPETIATEDLRFVCLEKCRLLRDRRSAELLLRPRGKGPTSLAIPLELVEQDLSPLCDLIIHPDLKFLTIDHVYCNLLHFDSGALHEHTSLSVSPPRRTFFPSSLTRLEETLKPCSTFNPPVRGATQHRETLRMASPMRSQNIPDRPIPAA